MNTITQSYAATKLSRWFMASSQQWQTLLVVAAVLFISIVMPMGLAPSRVMLLIALLVAIGGALFLLYHPHWGIITLFVTGLLAPSPALPGGLNFAVLQLGLLVALWLLKLLVSRREQNLVLSRTIRPMLCLVGVTLLAFISGQLPWFPLAQAPIDTQIGATLIFVLGVGAFLLVAHEIQELRWLEWMSWLLLILGGIFALGWVTPLSLITTRTFQVGATANAIFWTWLIALSFSLALFHETLAWRWRILAGGICLVSLYVTCILQYDWKSAWLPPLVAIGAILIAWSWRLGLFLGLLGYVPAQIISLRAIASDEYSYSTRIDAWAIILKMLGVNPILGFGPANYYWYTPLYRIRGYAVQFNSHNQYLDILAQIGILGMGCVLWFFAEAAWLGWRLCAEAPKGFARAYAYAGLGGLAGTVASGMLVDWFFPFVYNIGFNGFRSSIFAWLFLGGLVSVEQIIRRQSKATEESS